MPAPVPLAAALLLAPTPARCCAPAPVSAPTPLVPLAAPQSAAATAAAAAPDLSTPEKAVEALFAAYNRADARAMVPCVLGAALTPALERSARDFAREPGRDRVALADVRVYRDAAGAEAVVTFVLDWQTRPGSAGPGGGGSSAAAPGDDPALPKRTREVALVRRAADGAWRVVPPPPGPDGGGGGADAAQEPPRSEMTGLLALLVRYPEAAEAANRAARTSQAEAHFKAVVTALLTYAVDADGVLPPDPNRYAATIGPYVRDPAVLTSPLDPARTLSFRMNPALAGRNLNEAPRPETLVLMYEGEYERPLFRYEGRALFAFADGAIRLLTPEEARGVRWKP